MSAPSKKTINLLANEGFEHTQLGKLLAWLLSAGRTIVVITEVIVITAFLSRFWLDKTLTDLNEENTAKKNQIEASGAFEKDFRAVQARLTAEKTLESNRTNAIRIVKDLARLLPAGVLLTNISFSNDQVVLRGEALSEGGVAGFIKALDQNGYKNPAISELAIGTAGQQTISFGIKVTAAKKPTGGQNGS